MNEEMKR